ncbi:MAG: Crp/Fnr family transcriptional regulator, partial [Byssovorax sp.]
LGEMAILNGKPRTATATVVETTRCLVIEAKTLESMVARNAEIALRLIKKLAKRLDSADTLVEILMHRDPKARVMLALARHADAFGEPTEEGIRIRTTPEDIAREVGVDCSVADEVMARLRRLRLVTEEPGAVVVADIGRLRDFLEFLEMPQKFGGEG